MSEEDLGHRIWGWIGRNFGAPAPDPDNPRDMIPILESAPRDQVQTMAAHLVANDVAAFVAKCGPTGDVIVPWPTDILATNWLPYGQGRQRANLYVFRGQLDEAQAVIANRPSIKPDDIAPDQVP